MGSTFGSLQIGVRALQAHQMSLQVTGQNIANAKTEGYSRQVANLTTTDPYNNPGGVGQVGTGVEVSSIVSLRDKFIDGQIRNANSDLGQLQSEQSVYKFMESVFNENSDASISDSFDEFWSALNNLSTNAGDPTYREAVLEKASTLTGAINDTYTQLSNLQSDCDDKIATLVKQVNSYAEQIADLNKQIREVTATGQSANDLMDTREKYTQELSKLVNVSVQTTSTNEYNISIGGISLVSGDDVHELKTSPNITTGHLDITSSIGGIDVNINGGQIGGYLDMRDTVIQDYKDKLNEFASTLATEFNTVHANGYDLNGTAGGDFFTSTGPDYAANIKVAIADYKEIAASAVAPDANGPITGNGENAAALAKTINTTKFAGTNNMTLDQFYNNIAGQLSIDSNVCYSLNTNKQSLVDYLTNQQSSVSGVNKDEEAANLITFQKSYEAASRYITVIDQMLDTLINSTGTVGL